MGVSNGFETGSWWGDLLFAIPFCIALIIFSPFLWWESRQEKRRKALKEDKT